MRSKSLLISRLGVATVSIVLCAVSPALAAPEFFKGGAALNANEAIKYTSVNAGSKIVNLGFAGAEITCTAATGKGETKGPTKVQHVEIKFTGCQAPEGLLKVECKSPGANAKEIRTESLRGKLGYLKSGGNKPAGLSFEPENGTETFLAYKCGIVEGIKTVIGSALGEITTTPVEQETWEAVFAPNATNTAEKWIKFEEEGGKFELKAGCSTVLFKDKEEMTWENNQKIKIEGS